MGRRVLITGASSGIGQALAKELAARGDDLVLTARRVDALAALRDEIRRAHPQRRVEIRALDVTRYADVFPAVTDAAQALGGLDLVVANAGIGSNGPIGTGHFDADRATIETNVIGAMATIDAAVALFRKQNSGHVVAIASVAAARGLPGSGSYSASKAAIAAYAESARIELWHTPIRVTTLFPGYIDTPINQDMKRRPFLVTVERGAKDVADLIDRGVQEATVPVFPWNFMWGLLKLMPAALLARAVPSRKP